MAKIQVREAVRRFGNGPNTLTVLDKVDLDIEEHEFVVLVGPSGCGKTTLLNAIAGFVPLDEGSITIDGQLVQGPSMRRVYVSQESSSFPWLTVEENIAFPLRNAPAEVREKIVHEQMARVELSEFRDAYPSQLSGGMKQRLEFARALAVDPEMLFLDEPFGALDPFIRHEYCRELARIWMDTGKTCLMVTHDIEEACALATRIVVMSARPARILELLENRIPRPRDLRSEPFRNLKSHIQQMLKLTQVI